MMVRSFQISSFENVHTCSRAFHGRAFSSRWVAKKYIDQFRINPDMNLEQLIGKVMEDHEVELSRSKAYRAKQYAKVLIEGSYLEQYMRGAVAGQLLVVVGVDGNEGMYPIAYAVAEWARHAFPHYLKCDMLLNNICETFNSKIVVARTKPVMTMLETIRRYLTTRIQKNRDAMLKYQGLICPRIQEKLQKCKEESKGCTPKWGRGNMYMVTSDGKKYIVDIVKKSCACNKWDLTGIPCKHVVRAISYKGHNTEDYVDDYFKKKTYMRVYSHLIQPCNGLDFWPIAVGDLVLPPIHRKQPGRPKRMHRRRDPNEHQNSHKLKWNQNSLRCGQCHQIGHNKRSCKKKQTMLAGVGKTEAKAKGRKNVASSDKGKGKKRACNLDVNFMGFRIPARVGQDETRAKGKKNMASTNTEESSMGFRVPIGMSSQHSNSNSLQLFGTCNKFRRYKIKE
uniref:SWIM-type domain-containing protein n=1 Tax=Fagus sylvatica TaxID=28930 RepID=A0A2N9H0P7_FAGSY